MPRYSKFGQLDDVINEDGDTGFVRINNRLRPDQLQRGEVAVSENGRMDVDGAWQTRKGINSLGPTLTANTSSIRLTDPAVWKLYSGTPVSISSATRTTSGADGLITVVTSSAHGFSSDTLVYVYGLTGTVDPNGNRLITVTATDTFTFIIPGGAGSETYGGTGNVKAAALSSTQTTGVYGSCIFSDPSSESANYIIRATNQEAIATPVAGGASTSIAYPAGVSISGDVELLQCFDKVFIFRDGEVALEWDGDLSGSLTFTAVSSGVYSQPQYLNDAANTTIVDGVATVTHALGHGLSVGDKVWVIDRGATYLEESREYTVSAVNSNIEFEVVAQVDDASVTAVVWSKRISDGLGFIHMPYPAWGLYHQRRLWVPYRYEPDATGAPDRNVRDELIASDILDSNTYDHLENQFRITAGTADYLVGGLAFAEDNLLVFNRRSIHLISGISGSLRDTTVNLVTGELGCVARKSIVQVGNQVLFLSDNGVYAAAFGDLYNLRGAGVPLSESINETIARINPDYAYKAVAAYLNNRYYIAVPLDNNTDNNALLVYNFLNQGWESMDTVDSTSWRIQNLLIGENGGLASIYTISPSGSIHVLDGREDANDYLSLYAGIDPTTYPVESSVTLRQYTFGTMERKKFNSYGIHLESSASESSDASIAVEVENPDSSETLTTVSALLGSNLAVAEDASLRGRIGNKRGYGIQLTINPTNGRPKLRAARVQAALTNPTITQTS